MKRSVIVVFSLLLLLSTLGWASPNQTSKNDKLPSQISEYYKAYNFVNSFSSKSEREVLVSYLSRSSLPKEFKSNKRLEKIFTLMQTLKRDVTHIDPGIVFPRKPSNQEEVLSEGLLEIVNVRRHDNEVSVEVDGHCIDSETNSKLIAQYDEYKGEEKRLPSEEQIIEKARTKCSLGKEGIHIGKAYDRWLFADGQWIKSEVEIELLKDGPGGHFKFPKSDRAEFLH